MSTYFNSAKLCLIAVIVFVASANAETTTTEHTETTTKGLNFTGYVEGGYAYSWNAPAAPAVAGKDSEFLLDNANIRMGLDVSDRTSFIVDSAFSIRPPASAGGTSSGITSGSGLFNGPVGNPFNSSFYYAKTVLAGVTGNLAYAINEAYISNKWSDAFTMWVGQYKTPFGMESRISRYDMPTYYYSSAYINSQRFNMFYDLGIKLDFAGDTWGHLELSVTDGKSVLTPSANNASNLYSPAVAARYSYEIKNGDMTLMPVVSAYLGEWSGGPQDVALSGGVAYKTGVFNANAEFVLSAMSSNPQTDIQDAKVWSVYLEPGFDLGMLQVNIKGEYNNSSFGQGASPVSDFNVGASIGHTYMEKYRIRVAYQHLNLSGNNDGPVNDLRMLFGTKF